MTLTQLPILTPHLNTDPDPDPKPDPTPDPDLGNLSIMLPNLRFCTNLTVLQYDVDQSKKDRKRRRAPDEAMNGGE